MAAPDDAITLWQENENWKTNHWAATCECGWHGSSFELLCHADNETLWCPQCRTAAWIWD
jgi:hypothetical protein